MCLSGPLLESVHPTFLITPTFTLIPTLNTYIIDLSPPSPSVQSFVEQNRAVVFGPIGIAAMAFDALIIILCLISSELTPHPSLEIKPRIILYIVFLVGPIAFQHRRPLLS